MSYYQSIPSKSANKTPVSYNKNSISSRKTPRLADQTPTRSLSHETPKSSRTASRKLLLTDVGKNDEEIFSYKDDTDVIDIDNLEVEEQWNKKKKNNRSYFRKEILQRVHQSPSHLNKIIEHRPKGGNVKTKSHNLLLLKNRLVDHPATYLAPKVDFAVASAEKLILMKSEYQLLTGTTWLSNHLIDYIFTIFRKEFEDVQFETYKTPMIISDVVDRRQVPKVHKKILIAAYLNDQLQHFNLVIVNCRDKTFSLIDPMLSDPPVESYYQNFLNFVGRHNTKYPKNLMPTDWTIKNIKHPLQHDVWNCGVFILNFAEQYAKTKEINAEIDPSNYRTQLQHIILRKSVSMKDKCVLCGNVSLSKSNENDDGKLLWVQCDGCSRWTHLDCSHASEDILKDDSLRFFCIICMANTPKEINSDNGETSLQMAINNDDIKQSAVQANQSAVSANLMDADV